MRDELRVVHVITRLIVGGAQENTVASVLGLHRKPGISVHLISGPTEGSEGSLEPCFREAPELLSTASSLVRPIHPWKDVRALSELRRQISQRKPHLVHTHSGKAGILGRMAARRAKVPLIVHTIHGPSFGRFQGAVANAIFKQAERSVGRYTDHFISVADAMTRQYLEAGIGRPRQFTRILSGFELEPFLQARNDPAMRASLGLKENDFVVAKIARLTELKGHEDLFQVAKGTIEKCPQLKLLLIGDGPLRPKFEQVVRALGLERHVIFTGLIEPSRVASLIGVADCLVHLSMREGLPRALPQALAAGKPVISYDCDGAAEVCLDGKTGFLARSGDIAKVGRHLVQFAGNPDLRRQLGEAGKEFVREQFGVNRMVDAIYELYLRLCQQAGIRLMTAAHEVS
jgi:glycosyltransferase involved in cell wall biosynthesis